MIDPPGVSLSVSIDGQQRTLAPGEVFTFGRDSSCTVVLDAMDRGISRIAGALAWENGAWWVVNRSTKRALHIVDSLGLSVPLPVARSGWPPSKRAVDPAGLRVLVAGDVWTHEITLTYLEPPPPSVAAVADDAGTTTTHVPVLTEARKVVLIAMVSGYLAPFPRYNPQPLTYGEIGKTGASPQEYRHETGRSGPRPATSLGSARARRTRRSPAARRMAPSDASHNPRRPWSGSIDTSQK